MSLSVVKPMVINGSNMTTNVPIPSVWNGEELWDPDFPYEVGSLVLSSTADPYFYAAGIYEAITGGVHDTNPEYDDVNWKFVRVAARYRMFDNSSTSATFTNSETINVTVSSVEAVSFLALYGLQNAASVTVTMTQTATAAVVFSQTFSLQRPPLLANWYSYFFDAITNQTELHVPLPSYRGITLNVVITRANEIIGSVGCANMLVGSSVVLTDSVEYGAEMGIRDYSRKEKDEDTGADILVRRGHSKHLSVSFLINNASRAAVMQYLTELRAIPAIYIIDQIDILYGYYQDCKVTVDFLNESICTLTIEGLTQ